MKLRKNKSKKNSESKEVNSLEKPVNAWDAINKNFANINEICRTLRKSIQNLSVGTEFIKENNALLKRTIPITSYNSRKIPAFPLKLLN